MARVLRRLAPQPDFLRLLTFIKRSSKSCSNAGLRMESAGQSESESDNIQIRLQLERLSLLRGFLGRNPYSKHSPHDCLIKFALLFDTLKIFSPHNLSVLFAALDSPGRFRAILRTPFDILSDAKCTIEIEINGLGHIDFAFCCFSKGESSCRILNRTIIFPNSMSTSI